MVCMDNNLTKLELIGKRRKRKRERERERERGREREREISLYAIAAVLLKQDKGHRN